DMSWPAALLLGAVFASHTLIAYPVTAQLGISKSLPVTMAVGGTILTDALALGILTIVADVTHGQVGISHWLRLGLGLVAYVGLVHAMVPRLARAFFRNVGSRRDVELLFVLSILFAVAALAKVAGLEPIIGAFMAGLACNRFLPEHGPLLGRLRLVGNALFIPFFLLATGMLLNFRATIGDPAVWALAGTLLVAVVVAKFLACWLCGASFGHDHMERSVMFGLTLPQAAATLAATTVGMRLGLFDARLVNAILLLIMATCLFGPILVERAGRVIASRSETRDSMPVDTPSRVLVPIANPETAAGLLELALALRGLHQPVYALAVLPTGERSHAAVAHAEAALTEAIGDRDAELRTRVAPNVAAAVALAAIETRSGAIVLGWNGKRSLRRWVFGSVIDQVLETASQQVVVARLQAPLAAFSRLVLIVPPSVERHGRVAELLGKLRSLMAGMGSAVVWTVGSPWPSERLDFGGFVRTEALPDWKALAWLLGTTGPADLIVLVGARRKSAAWCPILEKLPALLAAQPGRSFLVLYPGHPDAERVPGLDAGSLDPAEEAAILPIPGKIW
ncbi:MAG: cation:proton antiporter, partial [Cyanobacteria bacterium REEB65]|nr:cation:proton antiporter [Cyanobacteria bacterium REEB65]